MGEILSAEEWERILRNFYDGRGGSLQLLRAHDAALRRERDQWAEWKGEADAECDAALMRANAAEREVTRLREALTLAQYIIQQERAYANTHYPPMAHVRQQWDSDIAAALSAPKEG